MSQLQLTADILAAALIGFEVQKIAVDGKIAEIRRMLGGGSTAPAAMIDATKLRTNRSAAVRRKMALAQRARWAKIKQGSEPPPAGKPKRKVSRAARKKMAEAQKRRWAAIKKAS